MSPTELRTARLLLRPFHASDEPAIVAYAGDAAYRRYLGPEHPEPRQFVANNLGIEWEREHAWVISADDALVGSIFLGVARPGAELACLLAPSAWRHGIATEAARAVIAHAFTTLELEKVWAHADASNIASIRGMERLGMHRQTASDDDVVYAITREEWQWE